MKITGIEAFVVAVPARRPHPMAFGGAQLGRYAIVQVHTDEGITGFGEATVLLQWGGDHGRRHGESPSTALHIARDVLGPALTGTDPFAIERAHERMDQTVKGHAYAKSAIDQALHDIKGKAFGVPVYELLGGLARREIKIAHSLGILDLATLRDEAAQAVEDGIGVIKIKIGLDADRDVEVVREVRDVIGDGPEIVVDANQGYATPKAAIHVLRRIEEYRIRYAEQPVEGLAQMARVARAVDIPIMADESAWNANDVLEIAERGAADFVSIYTTKPGGLAPAKKKAAVAEAAGFPCNVNGSAETGVGNAANIHLTASTACISEACVIPITTLAGREQTKVGGMFFTDDIITEPYTYKDGHLIVPDGPGLGIELDQAKVDRYRVA